MKQLINESSFSEEKENHDIMFLFHEIQSQD